MEFAAVYAAVLDAYARLAHAVDHREPEMHVALFTSDCVVELPGRDRIVGRDALLESRRAVAGPSMRHHVTNVIVDVGADGSSADASASVYVIHGSDRPNSEAMWRTHFRMDHEGWRIHRHRVVIDPVGQ